MATRTINLTDNERRLIIESNVPETIKTKIKNLDKERSARYGKNKGAARQKWVAERIAKLTGFVFDNSDDNSPIKTRPMGQKGVDIILSKGVQFCFPYDVEVKDCETLSIPNTINQARNNCKNGNDYLIVWNKKCFAEPIVFMDWSAFERLYLTTH